MPTKPAGLTKDQVIRAFEQLNPEAAYRWLNDNEYEWRGPGSVPTDIQIISAWSSVNTNDTARSTLHTQVITVAQTAVGVRFDALTAGQVRALFALLLNKEGALDTSGNIKPLNQWI